MTREEEILNQLVGLFGAADQQPKNTEVVFSKRQLNIAEEAEKRYLHRPPHQYYSAEDLAKAFRDGAEWADEHPKIMLHNADEEPTNKDANLLCFCKYMERPLLFPCGWLIDNLKSWKDAVRNLTITHWLYTEDIVPKDLNNF